MAQAELEDVRRQIGDIKVEAGALLRGVPGAQLWQPPPEGGWSIGDCLAHLNVTGRLYADKLSAAITQAQEKGVRGAGPFRYGLLGGLFVRLQEPPVKRRVKTPKVFVPAAAPDEDVVTPFLSLQDVFWGLSERAEGLDLARVTVTSPATRFLRLSLLEAFGATLAHERRHLWQAARVKEALRPAAPP